MSRCPISKPHLAHKYMVNRESVQCDGYRPGYVQTRALDAIVRERQAQDEKWGVQNHPNGTGITGDRERADSARHVCEVMFRNGMGSWRDILHEEVQEAFAEHDPVKLREELIQVAAVALAWVENMDRGGQPECSKHCSEMHTEMDANCVIWRNRHNGS